MTESMTLVDFQKRFDTEEACLQYLGGLRWPNGFRCPNCGHDDGYALAARRLMQCAVCRHQTSVTAGTIFHKTRTPLVKWFWIIYMMSQDKGGASALRMATQLGMFYSTVWHIVQKIRHAMASRDERISLSGFIELDEAIIGPHARKTGRIGTPGGKSPRKKRLGPLPSPGTRRKTQTEVIVMVERENAQAGNLAMKVVMKATRFDLQEAVAQRVEDNMQWFKSDAYQPHFAVIGMGHRLQAQPLSNSPASIEELPIVHRAISLFKRFLMGTYHGVSDRYLQCYADEFSFRWNRRHKENKIVGSLLRACVLTVPCTYAEVKR